MEKRIAAVDLDKTLFNCKSLCYTLFNLLPWNRKKKLKFFEIERTATIKQSKANKIFRLLNPKFYFTYPDAVETINELKELGFEVQLLSNRPNIRPIVALTIISLENHGIKYDKLVLGCTNKEEYAKREGIDYLIDNTKTLCKSLAKNTDVKSLCFKPGTKKDKTAKRKKLFSEIKKESKSTCKNRLKRAPVNEFSSWKGIGEFFKLENQKRNDAVKMVESLKEKALKNFISKGLCLPAPQKVK